MRFFFLLSFLCTSLCIHITHVDKKYIKMFHISNWLITSYKMVWNTKNRTSSYCSLLCERKRPKCISHFFCFKRWLNTLHKFEKNWWRQSQFCSYIGKWEMIMMRSIYQSAVKRHIHTVLLLVVVFLWMCKRWHKTQITWKFIPLALGKDTRTHWKEIYLMCIMQFVAASLSREDQENDLDYSS